MIGALLCALTLSYGIGFPSAHAQQYEPSIEGEIEAPPTADLEVTGTQTAGPEPLPPLESVEQGTPTDADPNPSPEPQLIARQYNVRVIRPSSSGKVYLLQKTKPSVLPKEGKILLIRDSTESPLMALRVVKQYPTDGRFAAKRIKRYGQTRRLPRLTILASLEKAGDFFPETKVSPVEQKALEADIKELESPLPPLDEGAEFTDMPSSVSEEEPLPETNAFDPELDETPKAPTQRDSMEENKNLTSLVKNLSVNEYGNEYELESSSATTEDMMQFDWLRSSMGGQVGVFKNNTTEGTSVYFTGAGIRYGTTFGRYLLLQSAHTQDSLSADFAVNIYKILNFVQADAYTVMPIAATLRYNIHLSPNLYLFLYGGLNRAFITSAVEATDDGISALTALLPSAGLGLSITIGPRWEVRTDLGIDAISGGLVLRF